MRGRRWRLARSVGLAFVVATIAGCPEPSELDNPEQYPAPPPAPTQVGTPSCETPCALELLGAKGCSVCHTKDAPLAFSQLDLSSPNRAGRLRDVPAKHLADPPLPAGACQTGDLLIDSAAPENSWLLKKVAGQHDTCGGPMPGPALTGEDLTCMRSYVACVAGK